MWDIIFNNAFYSWALLSLVPLFLIHWYRLTVKDSQPFSTLFLLDELNEKLPTSRNFNLLRFLLRALIITALILYFSRPEIQKWIETPQPLNIHIVDCSASMNIENNQYLLNNSLKNNVKTHKGEHLLYSWQSNINLIGEIEEEQFTTLLKNAYGTLDIESLTHFITKTKEHNQSNKRKIQFFLYSDFRGSDWREFLRADIKSPIMDLKVNIIKSSISRNIRIGDMHWSRNHDNLNEISLFVECINDGHLPQHFGLHCHTQGIKPLRSDILLGSNSRKYIEFILTGGSAFYIDGHIYIDFQDNFLLDNKKHFVIPRDPKVSIMKSTSTLDNNNSHLDTFIQNQPWLEVTNIEWNRLLQYSPDLLIINESDLITQENRLLLDAYLNGDKFILFTPSSFKSSNHAAELFALKEYRINSFASNGSPNQFSPKINNHPITQSLSNNDVESMLNARFIKWVEIVGLNHPILSYKNNYPAFAFEKIKNSTLLYSAFQWNDEWSDWFRTSSSKQFIQGLFLWIEQQRYKYYNRSIDQNWTRDILAPGIYLSNEIPVAWNINSRESDFSSNSFLLEQWVKNNQIFVDQPIIYSENRVLIEQKNLSDLLLYILLFLLLLEFIQVTRDLRNR